MLFRTVLLHERLKSPATRIFLWQLMQINITKISILCVAGRAASLPEGPENLKKKKKKKEYLEASRFYKC